MKLIEFKINRKKKGCGIKANSIVDEPASMVNFVKLSKEEKPVVNLSVNKEQQIITGPLVVPNVKMYRTAASLGGDEDGYIYFSEETCKKMFELFMENEFQNNLTLNHDQETQDLKLIEAWLIIDPKMDKAVSLGFDLPANTPMVSYKVLNKDLWDKIKRGEFNGFSIEAIGLEAVELSKEEIELAEQKYEWVVGGNEEHCPMCLEAQHYSARTKEQWANSKFGLPGDGKTFCKENCQCRLEPVTEMSKKEVEQELSEDEIAETIVEEFYNIYKKKLNLGGPGSGRKPEGGSQAITTKEAESYAKDTLGIDANYEGISVQSANDINNGIGDIVNDFPEVKMNYIKIDNKLSYEGATYDGKGININPKIDDVNIQNNLLDMPEGTNSIKGLINHEFSHGIDAQYNISGDAYKKPTKGNKDFDKIYKDFVKKAKTYSDTNPSNTAYRDYFRNNLSRNASTRKAEFLADAYAEYRTSPNPRETAISVGKVIDTYKSK